MNKNIEFTFNIHDGFDQNVCSEIQSMYASHEIQIDFKVPLCCNALFILTNHIKTDELLMIITLGSATENQKYICQPKV